MFTFVVKKVRHLSVHYGKKIGIDLPYFVKNGFWIYCWQFVGIIKWFTLSIIMTSLLPKEIYGQRQFAVTAIGMATIVALPGMSIALIRAIAQGHDKTYHTALRTVWNRSFLWTIGLLAFAVYGYFVGRGYGSWIFVFIAALFPLYNLVPYFGSRLNGKWQFDRLFKWWLIRDLFELGVMTVVVLMTDQVFWIIATSLLMTISLQWYYTWKTRYEIDPHSNIDHWTIAFGKKISISRWIQYLNEYLDKLLVTYFLWFKELAIYTIAVLIPGQGEVITKPIMHLLLPKLATHDMSGAIQSRLWKYTSVLLLLCLLVVIAYRVVSPYVFLTFYPDYVASSLYPSQIYMISFLAACGWLWATYYRAMAYETPLLVAEVAKVIALIVGAWIYIPMYWLWWAILVKWWVRIFGFLIYVFWPKSLIKNKNHVPLDPL